MLTENYADVAVTAGADNSTQCNDSECEGLDVTVESRLLVAFDATSGEVRLRGGPFEDDVTESVILTCTSVPATAAAMFAYQRAPEPTRAAETVLLVIPALDAWQLVQDITAQLSYDTILELARRQQGSVPGDRIEQLATELGDPGDGDASDSTIVVGDDYVYDDSAEMDIDILDGKAGA